MTADNRSPGHSSLQSVGPLLLFLAVNRLAGLRWAVITATILSVALVIDRRRRGIPLGKFMPLITAAVLIRGAIGAITESEALYFGLGIAAKYAAAAVMLGSVLLRRPLAERVAPTVMALPDGAKDHPSFTKAMAAMTALAGLYYCISATVDIWLFQRTSVEGFVALRFLTNWPLGALTLLAILGAAQHYLQKIPGISSVMDLVEAKMGADSGPQAAQNPGTTPK